MYTPVLNEMLRLSLSDIKHSHGAYRRTGAAADLERQANKAETSSTNELVQIDQIFIVCESQLPADVMDFPVGNMAHARRLCLDAKRRDLLLPQPARRSRADPGTLLPIGGAEGAAIVVCIQQDRISLPDVQARCEESLFQISDLDQLPRTFVRKVKADPFGIEHRQRHRVDGSPPVLAPHVVEGIDMCPGMLAQLQPVHRRRNDLTIRDLVPLFMRDVHVDVHFGKSRKDRHARVDLLAQINDLRHTISSLLTGIP